ncbi:ATP-binding protein [Streptomyces sp. NPDC057611]|uniref:ATP-binding protein n=1 Tax=Streptomyces sp. NPDC057611 TaxID=3346182 RepID=UPI00367810A9
MRSLTQTRLHQSGLSRLADDAALVVSELVTNAVQHSHGRKITLTLALRDGHLDIRVHDGVPSRLPIAPKPDAHAENGRGLWLVESIASQWHGSWGISDKGATTWCDLALEVS